MLRLPDAGDTAKVRKPAKNVVTVE